MFALDAVNDRWGAGTLHYASSGITKAWKTQFHRCSQAYTTDWNALPVGDYLTIPGEEEWYAFRR